MARLRIGWFSTGRGPGSRALLTAAVTAIRSGELDAEIAVVFSNRERGQDAQTDLFLDLAQGYGLPVVALSDRRFRREQGGAVARSGEPLPAWRAAYDEALLAALAPYPFDVGMLAGYMLILAPATTRARPFLNLHPAAPGGPIGVWQDVIWELIDQRATASGVLINVVTPELDEGPVVAYCHYSLRGPDLDPLWAAIGERSAADLRAAEGEALPLFQAIRRQGAARELPLALRALAALAAGRVQLAGVSIRDASGQPVAGADLTDEVERALAASSLPR